MSKAAHYEPFWRDKSVLVTGSSGFAGRNLCVLLSSLGSRVRFFDRSKNDFSANQPGTSFVLGDVQDYQSVLDALKGVDVAFHLAAITLIPETRAKTFNTFATNALGTLNFLMAAKAQDVPRLVYVSTCHVYGRQEKLPITEDAAPKPIDIYSASKLSGESLALSFAEMHGMNISISRAFNHYGPYQRPDFLVPSIILRLLRGEKLAMGNPTPTRDFSYVEDIVRGYALLAEKGRSSEIYHFSSGEERSVQEIVETIMKISGVKSEVHWNPEARRIDIPRSVGDYSKARKELGWTPRVDFEDGMKKTVAWYRSQLDQRNHEMIHVPNA
ncbi:MAG TPA: NAD(P)-dependent oxidoreductase [Candidatus Dormibacteraeota bacterium]|nr:NAD(P)-dependent oxidoreductase [Candidatus Dormibacteraeota bacterium]